MVGASRAEASQVRTSAALAGVRVRDILLPDGGLAPTARGWQTVGAFLEDEGGEGLAHTAATAYPVRDFDGQLSGLVTLTQLLSVPAEPPRRHPAVPGRHPGGRPGLHHAG